MDRDWKIVISKWLNHEHQFSVRIREKKVIMLNYKLNNIS